MDCDIRMGKSFKRIKKSKETTMTSKRGLYSSFKPSNDVEIRQNNLNTQINILGQEAKKHWKKVDPDNNLFSTQSSSDGRTGIKEEQEKPSLSDAKVFPAMEGGIKHRKAVSNI